MFKFVLNFAYIPVEHGNINSFYNELKLFKSYFTELINDKNLLFSKDL